MQSFIVVDQQQSTIIRFSAEAIWATPEEVMRYLAGSGYKGDSGLHGPTTATIELAIRLASPVLTYALHGVRAMETHGKLLLENGFCLEVPHAESDPDIRYLAACVCSLGGDIENACFRLTNQGQRFQAMLLDAAGVGLLDALANRSHEHLRERAKELQLFPGCPFGPGYDGMPIETQSLLFRLVDAGAIRVKLNDSLVMEPMKSLSFFVRLSARENPRGPLFKCRRCELRDCQFRTHELEAS